MARAMNRRLPIAFGGMVIGVALTACSSGTTSPTTTAVSTPTTTASTPTAPPGSTTTAASATSATATCPTLAQAEAALGGSHSGPIQTPTPGGGVVCEYTGASGNAGVTIFAHQSATVFAGQVAHAPGNPAMPAITGVGDGAYGMTSAAGRSIVNAYSNGSRTVVAAQANGSLASVEALARTALAAN